MMRHENGKGCCLSRFQRFPHFCVLHQEPRAVKRGRFYTTKKVTYTLKAWVG